MNSQMNGVALPNEDGFFGEYGGQFIPPHLKAAMDDIKVAYEEIRQTPEFQQELAELFAHYVGRPSPLFHAKRLSEQLGGAQIYLKREDLNHTGAHKINHCLGEALLAKYMGKTKVIAETGAGQHGVALATACALVGIPCEIHMGQVDIEKEHPNVVKMKILGAKLISVTRGTATLKDAVDSAFEEYLKDPKNYIYAIGSVVGPHPFPMMVRDFQAIIGDEIKVQAQERFGAQPDYIVACVGGGSNAVGAFTAFLNDPEVKLVGVEPAGHGLNTDMHSATLTLGKPGQLHGMACYVLEDEQGEPLPVHSIASGLDYPGVGPQHSFLKDAGRVEYTTATDQECLDAFIQLSRVEGIVPALESSHAVAWAMREAPKMSKDTNIVVNLSGRGDKDADYVAHKLGLN
ncbi:MULTISPECIES: tryptophan synthase subunit beta [Acinetobacter]|uniref:Tryptophan synthase beta chain n=2 Tax=Acinetobacter indicus TaxID=756892 RepID=V2VL34_9GAMM|nr:MULTISPECIES: tryptophan synthase subunit beta [Acinetobacter]EPF72958.1 tryptophan synthase, beta subunit [Acinetobacter indicus ANC 4215]ESK48299.1 tryptophan synthase, beta subunit [Acinetobacter indicus CIP 110367]MCO8109178.1 tryptophan synthase subunit beta [Acinetobacter indicus]MDM1263322.1 tryptophan synthase subunit beta [Acinetobacter indicus]MDM1771537.1 tryptophan synthase subunit beta [Acinetobacter indicus]